MKETKLVSIINKQKNPTTRAKPHIVDQSSPRGLAPSPQRLKRIKTVTWFSCKSDK